MSRRVGWFVATSFLLTAFFGAQLAVRFRDPFPPLAVSLSTEVTSIRDFTGIAAGFRRLAADLAWIQTLQYYGTQEEGQSEFDFHNGIGRYPLLLAYCQRVARIDPYFTYAYYYGGGALGWNLGRWAEAEALLRQGIENNPKNFRLQQYLAAMAYKHDQDVDKLMQFLESFVNDPDCPNLLRSLLANLYKKQKLYAKALGIWLQVYDTGDPTYLDRAKNQIEKLTPMASLGPRF